MLRELGSGAGGLVIGKQGDWWRKQGEEETRKWEWKRRWLRETDEEGECERGQIDEWMFVHAAARQMPIYYTKWVFRIEVMFRKRLEGGSTRFQSSPLFSSSNPSRVGFEKDQNKLNKLFNRCLRVVIHASHSKITVTGVRVSRGTLDYSYRSRIAKSSKLQPFCTDDWP